MTEITQRFVEANGIRVHVAEQGSGPLVLFCHGFPESWYSWRHQLRAVAAAGFRGVAPDMRGYGRTEAPPAIDDYTIFHLVGDMVGLLDALGAETAVIVGHDWGAPVAWHAALMRPDRFRAVAGLSVPFFPRGRRPPTTAMPQDDEALFYQLYFQSPGVAELELEHDVERSLRGILYSASGDAPKPDHSAPRGAGFGMVSRKGGFLTQTRAPKPFPSWLSEDDIAVYVDAFRQSGFRGGLNWYRNIDRNWALTAPFAGLRLAVPALYMIGEHDIVKRFPGMDDLIAALPALIPTLRRSIVLPGCGHWTQQERAEEVNGALVEFLQTL